jgi:hypothetical protein
MVFLDRPASYDQKPKVFRLLDGGLWISLLVLLVGALLKLIG